MKINNVGDYCLVGVIFHSRIFPNINFVVNASLILSYVFLTHLNNFHQKPVLLYQDCFLVIAMYFSFRNHVFFILVSFYLTTSFHVIHFRKISIEDCMLLNETSIMMINYCCILFVWYRVTVAFHIHWLPNTQERWSWHNQYTGRYARNYCEIKARIGNLLPREKSNVSIVNIYMISYITVFTTIRQNVLYPTTVWNERNRPYNLRNVWLFIMFRSQWPLLLTWINFNPSMDK